MVDSAVRLTQRQLLPRAAALLHGISNDRSRHHGDVSPRMVGLPPEQGLNRRTPCLPARLMALPPLLEELAGGLG